MTTQTMDIATARDICQRFANEHEIIFKKRGTCGFGRPCVGFSSGDQWIDYNPYHRTTYEPLPGFSGDRLRAPYDLVPDTYHKADCLAVLAHPKAERGSGMFAGDLDEMDLYDYDPAIIQLALWVQHMEAQGPLEVVDHETGATGLQVIVSGLLGRAIRLRHGDRPRPTGD